MCVRFSPYLFTSGLRFTQFTDVATMGFFWGGAIRTDFTVSGALNFTVGASASASIPVDEYLSASNHGADTYRRNGDIRGNELGPIVCYGLVVHPRAQVERQLISLNYRDKASFDIHPFRLNSGSFEVTAGISLSPFLDATVSFGTGVGKEGILSSNRD